MEKFYKMKNLIFKKYRSVEIIEAVEHSEEMIDGYEIRYGSEDEAEKYRKGEIESISTWALPGPDDTVEYKVPYIEIEGNKILMGEGYFLVSKNGQFFSMKEKDFKEKYELI